MDGHWIVKSPIIPSITSLNKSSMFSSYHTAEEGSFPQSSCTACCAPGMASMMSSCHIFQSAWRSAQDWGSPSPWSFNQQGHTECHGSWVEYPSSQDVFTWLRNTNNEDSWAELHWWDFLHAGEALSCWCLCLLSVTCQHAHFIPPLFLFAFTFHKFNLLHSFQFLFPPLQSHFKNRKDNLIGL